MTRRSTIKPGHTVGLLLVLVLALGACGDPSQDYCASVKDRNRAIAEMIDSDSPAALLNGLPMLRELAEQSPSDLRDEWQIFLGALESLDEEIRKAGAKPSDFKDGKPPPGLSDSAQLAISEAADQIGAEDVVQSASGIEQQARDVCKVNLGLS